MRRQSKPNYLDKVFFVDSRNMSELPDNSVHLIVTSPPYFNIKDYSLDGYQQETHSDQKLGQIGDVADYEDYIKRVVVCMERM
ncbi:MAG: hypothetical protein LBC74_16320 [Planctomycetaceae bacterium]|jgi:DNA modification methylase|nr:hypothetical protein [Planctomycetaceae bacterium]